MKVDKNLRKILKDRFGLDVPTTNSAISPWRLPRDIENNIGYEDNPKRIILQVGGIPTNWANARFGHDANKNKFSGQWRKEFARISKIALAGAKDLSPESLKLPRLVQVTYFRCWPRFDWDGAVIAAKPLIDGLVDGGILQNDTEDDIIWARPRQIRVKSHNEEHCVVTITFLEDAQRACPTCGTAL